MISNWKAQEDMKKQTPQLAATESHTLSTQDQILVVWKKQQNGVGIAKRAI